MTAVFVGVTVGCMEVGVDTLTDIPGALGGSWETFPQARFPCQALIRGWGGLICPTAT